MCVASQCACGGVVAAVAAGVFVCAAAVRVKGWHPGTATATHASLSVPSASFAHGRAVPVCFDVTAVCCEGPAAAVRATVCLTHPQPPGHPSRGASAAQRQEKREVSRQVRRRPPGVCVAFGVVVVAAARPLVTLCVDPSEGRGVVIVVLAVVVVVAVGH